MASKDRNERPIIVRREEIVEGGGHGGAWKVAYADFVTAMMAFFLVMWLLNTTTPEQRKGLADYFSPNNALNMGHSGSGKPFGGKTPFDEGELVSDKGAETVLPGMMPHNPNADDDDADATMPKPAEDPAPTVVQANAGRQDDGTATAARQAVQPGAAELGAAGPGADGPGATVPVVTVPVVTVTNPAQDAASQAARKAEQRRQQRQERQAFAEAAAQIRQAVVDDPDLAELARQLVIDQTPEGMRIQILDADRQPMFATGSSALNERARALVLKIAPILMRLPNGISIAGHTDAAPYHGTEKTNWDLSSERANATRRLLTEAGLPEARLRSVTGNADRSLLLPADPLAAANRRIAIVVLRAGQ
jgi:chemotaxis protein MotB